MILKILARKGPTNAQNMNRQSKMYSLSDEKFTQFKWNFQEETLPR